MKASYFLSFLCGAAMMLGFSTLRGSNAEFPHHVYELRRVEGDGPDGKSHQDGFAVDRFLIDAEPGVTAYY
jgi:hypothetical protein